ncbi:uncharacterized protein LOC129589497 [Paramacrobiotus metropolitanus]|uniref:uncharacterized protein LOC129589497 n=1 Tax=Paramacrobiotus metropolitanus TaxID=2943436 RepID=UPI0024464AB7|nr:uncharacterized protein LOC129589497 [Paramacrobiotus metropolitanus]
MPSGIGRNNSVDVLGDDGMMRYGRVVDVSDDGLFIDMLCPNRRREPVPYHSVFRPNKMSKCDLKRERNSSLTVLSVEILLPQTPSGPWIWLPGESDSFLLENAAHQHTGAVVHWRSMGNGKSCTDFLPIERIRLPVEEALKQRRMMRNKRCADDEDAAQSDHIRSGTFVKRTEQLDDEFRSVSAKDVAALIKRLDLLQLSFSCDYENSDDRDNPFYHVDVVDLVDGQLGYLSEVGAAERSQWGRKLLRAMMVSNAHGKLSELAAIVAEEMALPVELWLDVFSYLDTVTQTQLRAVCAAWNALMESPALRCRIIVGDESWDCIKREYRVFLSLAAVYKCLRRETQHIVVDIRRRRLDSGNIVALCDMIRFVADQQTEIRLKSVLFSKLVHFLVFTHGVHDVVLADDACYKLTYSSSVCSRTLPLQHFIAICASLLCNTLVMANWQVCLVYKYLRRGRGRYPVEGIVWAKVPSARLTTGSDFRCAFLDALETGLPVLTDQKLEDVRQEFNSLGDSPNDVSVKDAVCEWLSAVQSADPRPSTHYRGKTWHEDDLQGLQLEKLSVLSGIFWLGTD